MTTPNFQESVSYDGGPEDFVENYWTEERMAAAVPVPLPEGPDEAEAALIAAAMQIQPDGEEASEDGMEPTDPVDPYSAEDAAALAVEEALASTCPATKVTDMSKLPYIACGKLWFTQGGTDYVGSAAAIDQHILLTAGHCLVEGGSGDSNGNNASWSSNVVFIAHYKPWTIHVPRYTAQRLWAWKPWIISKNWAYDYAMIHVAANMEPKIGYLGKLWNASTNKTWLACGYPAAPPYSGDQFYTTSGGLYTGDPKTAGTTGMNNNGMTGGCSGGPWLTNTDNLYANGINSYSYGSTPCNMWSPYFDSSFKKLVDDAK